MPFSKGSSHGKNPCLLCLLHWQAGSLPQHHLESHLFYIEHHVDLNFPIPPTTTTPIHYF